MKLLRIGAFANFVLAAGHVVCLFFLDAAFRFYGLEDLMMVRLASYGAYLPYLLTVAVALCFALAGLYGLSAAQVIRPLPLLRLGIFVICIVFLGRAVWGVVSMLNAFSCQVLLSTLIAGAIGLCYLLGGTRYRFDR